MRPDRKTGHLEITRIDRRGAAYQSGLRKNDLLVSIGEVPVEKPEDVSQLLSLLNAGDRIELEFVRDGDDCAPLCKASAKVVILLESILKPIESFGDYFFWKVSQRDRSFIHLNTRHNTARHKYVWEGGAVVSHITN